MREQQSKPASNVASKRTAARVSATPAVAPTSRTNEHLAFQLQGAPAATTPEELDANRAADDAVASASPYGVIVEDGLPVGDGQINRTAFMDRVEPAITRTAESILQPAGREAKDCPYLEFWVSYYRDQSAAHIERALAKYVKPDPPDIDGIEKAILAHVTEAVAGWVYDRSVQVPGEIDWRVKDDLVDDDSADGAVAQRMGADGHGAPAAPGSAAAIRGQLSSGRPLDASVRTRMERGFGTSFTDVRVHTDQRAVSAAQRFDARAFAVGQDIGFGAGEYRPGSLSGDLLLAHELAHTIQQRGAHATNEGAQDYEADATRAAIGAVVPGMEGQHAPRMRGGLLLRRCGTGEEPAPKGVSEAEYQEAITELKTLYAQRAGADVPETDKAAIDRRIRELTQKVWGWGVQLSDEQLQRAVEAGDDLRKGVDAPAPEETAKPGTPPNVTGQAKDVDALDLTGIKFEAKSTDDRVLLLWNKKDLYVLPARSLVYTAPTKSPQSGGPVFGVPVAGHAGAYLVKTDSGVGMMVDAGGKRTGGPNVLMPASLEYLQVRMNIREIDGAMLSHAHADHIDNVPMLVRREQLTGNIYVWPGWESATAGGFGKLWDLLRDPSFTQFGKGPGWQPTTVTVQEIPGPAGKTGVTQGMLRIGGAQYDFVASTEKLRRYVQALRSGQTGKQDIDAASSLLRITPVGGKFSILVVGDWRGSYIKDLHAQMGEPAFTEFVKDTRVFGGMHHHLGAVNSKADVEGIRILLKAIGPTAEPLTAAVQTGASNNAELIAALRQSGVRVVTLGEIDPANPGKVTFTEKGELRSSRASVFEPEPAVRSAQARIVDMLRAAEALEKYPDEMRSEGKTTGEIAAGLRTEAARLRAAVESRQELATSKLHRTTAVADVDAQLTRNGIELNRIAGMEADLGDKVSMLSRFRSRAEEIRLERARARQRGESSLRLRQLIAQVDPKRAAEILAEELNAAGLSRRNERRALRSARARLIEQGRLSQLAEPGAPRFSGIGTRSGGVAVGLIALEVFNLAEPFITQYVQERREATHKDFYTFLQVASWWQEHGASVPVVGMRGNQVVTNSGDMLASLRKRIWKDLPNDRQAPERDLDAAIKAAVPLDKLFVPELVAWKNQALIWDAFRDWVTSNVKDFNDYAAEFKDVESPAIRAKGPSFEELLWEVRTGRLDGDHVTDGWQFSPELTTIMRATAARVIEGTEATIEKEKARPGPTRPTASSAPSISSAVSTSDDSPNIGQPPTAATSTGRFKSDASRKAHGNYRFKETAPSPAWGSKDEPEFLLYESERPPRAGYVLAGPGDYNTYARMRGVRVWTYDPEQSVKLPKRTVKPNEVIPTEPVRSAREQYAEDAKRKGEGEFIASDGTIYYGELRFPYFAPNEVPYLWLKKDDLDIKPRAPSGPAPK